MLGKTASKIASKLRGVCDRHAARNQPSGFSLSLGDRIGFLNRDHWDAVTAGGSVFASRRYLEALERSLPANVSPSYAMAYRGAEPVAAICMQFAELGAADLVAPRGDDGGHCAADVRPRIRAKLRAKLLVCGNLLVWGGHGVTFAKGVTAGEAWPAVADALYAARRASGLRTRTDFVVVKDLAEHEREGIASLETYSYRSFATEPDMVLDLPESVKSFADYLGLFRSRYRKAAKAIVTDAAAAGCTLERVTDIAPLRDEVQRLYLDVHSRAAVRLFTLSPVYLPALATHLGDDFRCVLLRRAGRPQGFVTVVRDGDTAVAYHMGFEGAANREAPIYFRLLYAAVEESIALGCRRVSFGRTALEPKARLGARPVPLSCWIRHRVPVVNVAMRRWLRTMRHDVPPDRSPLRED